MKNKLVILVIFFLIILGEVALGIIEEGSLYEKFILERGILRKSLLENFFLNYANGLKLLYENNFLELLQKNPDPFHPINQGITNYLIFILEPLCILGLLMIGLYLIFLSGTPWGRAFAKSLLPSLILAILFIPLSSYLMFIFLGISDTLTKEILSLSAGDPVKIFTDVIGYISKEYSKLNEISFLLSLPFIFLALSLLLITLILFVIRYLLVTFFVVILPVTLFLYLFTLTREMGRRFLELTISLTLVQVVVAIALVSISGVILLLPPTISEEIKILAELAGSFSLILITIGAIAIFKNYLP